MRILLLDIRIRIMFFIVRIPQLFCLLNAIIIRILSNKLYLGLYYVIF
jgi:hypothetical protein